MTFDVGGGGKRSLRGILSWLSWFGLMYVKLLLCCVSGTWRLDSRVFVSHIIRDVMNKRNGHIISSQRGKITLQNTDLTTLLIIWDKFNVSRLEWNAGLFWWKHPLPVYERRLHCRLRNVGIKRAVLTDSCSAVAFLTCHTGTRRCSRVWRKSTNCTKRRTESCTAAGKTLLNLLQLQSTFNWNGASFDFIICAPICGPQTVLWDQNSRKMNLNMNCSAIDPLIFMPLARSPEKLFITLGVSWSPVCPVCIVSARLRPADAPIPRSCVIWQGSAKKKKKHTHTERMNVWQLPVRSRIDCDERKEYKCLICRWVIEGRWAAGLMAASFRDSLWVAPEQDALLQPTAPLTDHGQVLCHTTDAMAPTPSGYHLVRFWFVCLQIIVILHLTRRSCKSALLNIEAWVRTWRWSCTGAALLSYFQSQHVTEISPVLMLTFTESQAGHGRDVKRCTRSTNLRGGQMHSAAEQLPVLISARFPNSSWLRAS